MRFHRLVQLKRRLAILLIALVVPLMMPLAAHADPWVTHAAKLPALNRQVEALDEEIKHLILAKKHITNPEQLKASVDEIADKYRELATTSEKLEKEKAHVRFQHPDHADEVERKYVRFKLKSLEDLESEVGIDGRLDRIKAKVVATFPPPVVEKAPETELKINAFFRKPASVDEDAPERIRLVK